MSIARPEAESPRHVGRLVWTALWWLVAAGGCGILIAACIATWPY